jgi:hypothetical protein
MIFEEYVEALSQQGKICGFKHPKSKNIRVSPYYEPYRVGTGINSG